jgi:glycerate 2-kinase
MIIKNREEVVSPANSWRRALVVDIIEAGLEAVDPYVNTRKLIRIEGGRLRVGGSPEMDISGLGEEAVDLSQIQNIYVLGAGKTVQRQAKALEDVLGERLTAGAVTIKKGEEIYLKKIEVTEGAHPVPDEHSVAGARKIVKIAQRAREGDLVFTLFSSGASSLFVIPMAGHTLEEIQAVYRLAIKHGDMRPIWSMMKHFSAVAGGRIMMLIHPARMVNLLMAIRNFEPWRGRIPEAGSWIASWPPGPRCLADSLRAWSATAWWEELPASMRSALESQAVKFEVPDLENFRAFKSSYWQPVDNRQMLEAAKRKAEELGYRGIILGNWWEVQSNDAAKIMVGMAEECVRYGTPFEPPVALLSGGEMTVSVGNAKGIGGRNQEFALQAAVRISELRGSGLVVGSVDSDGTDGPGTQLADDGTGDFRCLAGGIADEGTLAAAKALGIDLHAELRNHNSSLPLVQLKSGIYTGNTGIVGGDLRVLLIPKPS